MRKHSVAEIMTRDVVTVRESASFREIVEALASHRISAVPVVDTDGNVVGVVSEADLLHKVEFAGEESRSRLFERKQVRSAREKAGAGSAIDLMSAPAVVIGEHESVATAAKIMDAERVKRLPVVTLYGKLVGIVSRGDVLRLFLRTDEDIRREVEDDVFVRTLWIDPKNLSITVKDGVVTLAGAVDRRSTIGLVVSIVASVAGVVDVIDHLSYHFDDRHRASSEDMPIIA
jgi:CBS-domain-containing membrane protein